MSTAKSRSGTAQSQRGSSVASMGLAANFIKNLRKKKKGKLQAIKEKDSDDSDQSENSDTEDKQLYSRQRYNYDPPDDPQVAANIAMMIKYIQDTELEIVMSQLCQSLLNRPELPYNPYPGFVRRLRRHSEKFHMHMRDSQSIISLLDNGADATSIGHVWSSKSKPQIFGLHDMVQAVDPRSLQKYIWLINDLTPDTSTIYNKDDYSVQVLVSLVGPAVFTGTYYDDPITVNIRVEYLIFGPDLNRGAQLFIELLLEDMNNSMFKQTPHVFLGMDIPGTHERFPDSTINDLWTPDMMDSRREDFEAALIFSIQKAKPITMECVFLIDQLNGVYKRGNKQYLFHFVDTKDGQAEENLVASFSEFPYITAREGIFWKKAHVEAYLSMYMIREERVDFDNVKSYKNPAEIPRPVAPSSSSVTAGRRQASAAIDGRISQDHKSHTGKPQKLQKKKVLTDGFKIRENLYVPEGWKATSPIRESFQRRVSKMHPEADLFKIAELMVLLVLMDKESYGVEFSLELYRLLHSTAARLNHCIQLNTVVQELIRKYEGDSVDSLFVQNQFLAYKKKLLEIFNNESQECSSDLQIIHDALKRKLNDMMERTDNGIEILPVSIETNIQLRSLNFYCTSVLLELVEDALAVCPNIDGVIDAYIQTFPDEVLRPVTALLPVPSRQEGATPRQPIPPEDFLHGVEDYDIIKHDKQFINVKNAIDACNKPTIMATEAVLIQYLMDTKVDLMYESFLSELLSEQHLPPNPYPRLLSLFRQAGMKMTLWGESNDQIKSKILHSGGKLVDAENYVYHLAGCDVYGLQTALTCIDVPNFQKVVIIAKQFVNTEFPQRKGQFKIAMVFAVSGWSPWYGQLMPYIIKLDLHEHCYFKGPIGCHGEAILIYIDIVREYLFRENDNGSVVVMGLYIGEHSRWSIEDIKKKSSGFELELSKAIEAKQAVYIKMYKAIGWRYLCIQKHLLFHYVDNTEDDYETFFPNNPVSLYQNTFFLHEKAAFHFQQGGPEDRHDPYSSSNVKSTNVHIKQQMEFAISQQDYVSVFRWILIRSLVNKQYNLLADCWRLLHSTAYQIEYIMELNKSMQDLIISDLETTGTLAAAQERKRHPPPPDPNKPKKANQEEPPPPPPPEEQGPLKLSILGRMMNSYRQKMDQILRMGCTYAPRCLPSLIQNKLKQLSEKDQETNEIFLVVDYGSVPVLQEINEMLEPLLHSTAYDMFLACPDIQNMVKEIKAEVCERVTLESSRKEFTIRASQIPELDSAEPLDF